MCLRFNVVLSDDLNEAIDKAAEESESTKSEVLRKAPQLYLAAREGAPKGIRLGLAKPDTKLDTEVIGR